MHLVATAAWPQLVDRTELIPRLRLALQTLDKRKLLLHETPQCAASAICRSGTDGHHGNYRGGNFASAICGIRSSSDNSRSVHSYPGVLAEVTRNVCRRCGWFFPTAQVCNNQHKRT